jgi:hypothetical protein
MIWTHLERVVQIFSKYIISIFLQIVNSLFLFFKIGKGSDGELKPYDIRWDYYRQPSQASHIASHKPFSLDRKRNF